MTKLHSVHPKKGRGHFDLCLLVILIIFIIMRPDYFIQRNEIHRCKRTSRPAFLYDHKAGDFLAAAFVSMLFMSKTDYHKLLKLALSGIFIKHCTLAFWYLFLEKK